MLALLGACVAVAYHLVSGLARILAPLAGGLAPVLAIIACTAAVRLLLAPLSYYSLRGQASQARLLPQVRDLQQRHAGHPDRLQSELSQLYKREGTGLLAGCLPALLQLPFFSVLYRLLESRTIDGRPNSLLSHDLLRAPLAPTGWAAPARSASRARCFSDCSRYWPWSGGCRRGSRGASRPRRPRSGAVRQTAAVRRRAVVWPRAVVRPRAAVPQPGWSSAAAGAAGC